MLWTVARSGAKKKLNWFFLPILGEEIDHVQLAKKWANHKDYCKRKAKKINSDLGISYEPNKDGDSFNKSGISYESEADYENLKKQNIEIWKQKKALIRDELSLRHAPWMWNFNLFSWVVLWNFHFTKF